MRFFGLLALTFLLIGNAVLPSDAAEQSRVQAATEISAQAAKGGSCTMECKNSKCSISCPAGKEPSCYCSPNDYAVCDCVKPDKRKLRPRRAQ